jgi:hypothetical protein
MRRTARNLLTLALVAGSALSCASPEPTAESTAAFEQGWDGDLRMEGDAVLRRPILASGYGRVDALTQIVNSLAVRDQDKPQNLYPVKAPTSYPPLWLAPELEFVQWNPIASSPIARNGGQVLGVFGRVNLSPMGGGQPFASTMRLADLHAMEQWLQRLQPPRWDAARMGGIDAERAASGEELFREHCAGCHNMPPYRRTDPTDNLFGKTFIRIAPVQYRKVGTDPVYIEQLVLRHVETNPLTAELFGGATFVPAAAFFANVVGATVRAAMDQAELGREERIAMNGFRFRAGPDGKPETYSQKTLTALKAGPLAAAWATGPYLHNGSVPTIYELLAPEERRDVFWTGGRELDLERLGYMSEDAPGRFRFDTRLPGNGNQGHRYPVEGLSHEQRLAVIEYLKTQ